MVAAHDPYSPAQPAPPHHLHVSLNRSTIMSSYDDWYPSNYLKADDAIDNSMDLTITAIQPEKMQDGTFKPVVFFKEDKRGLVLNVTNKNFLVQLTRSKNPDDAVGQR